MAGHDMKACSKLPYSGCFCKSERLLAPAVSSFQDSKKHPATMPGVSGEGSVAAKPEAI
jgi:hypothetical protein